MLRLWMCERSSSSKEVFKPPPAAFVFLRVSIRKSNRISASENCVSLCLIEETFCVGQLLSIFTLFLSRKIRCCCKTPQVPHCPQHQTATSLCWSFVSESPTTSSFEQSLLPKTRSSCNFHCHQHLPLKSLRTHFFHFKFKEFSTYSSPFHRQTTPTVPCSCSPSPSRAQPIKSRYN